MRATSEKYRLNSYDGEELPFENYMKLDNTNPAPDEVAKMIKALFSIGILFCVRSIFPRLVERITNGAPV